MEVILVDDHSEIPLTVPATLSSRTRIIRLDESVGCAGARNIAIRAASNEVIIQIDDDAWLIEDDAAHEIANIMFDQADVAALALRVHYAWAEGVDGVGTIYPRWDREHLSEDYRFIGCAAALRRDAVIRAGLYPGEFARAWQEEFLSIGLFRQGYRIKVFSTRRVGHGDDSSLDPPSATQNGAGSREIFQIRHGILTHLVLFPRPLNCILAAIHLGAGLLKSPRMAVRALDGLSAMRHSLSRYPRLTYPQAWGYLAMKARILRLMRAGERVPGDQD